MGCSWGREESVDVAAPLKLSDCPSVSLLPPRRFLQWPREHLAMRAAHVQSRPHAQKKSSRQEQLLVTWLRKEGWKLRIPRQSTNTLLSVRRDKRWKLQIPLPEWFRYQMYWPISQSQEFLIVILLAR